ncbi:MAG: SpoIIE family protein phosphatase, partial [Clostridia bacterium]|nr:SpoIIE family protein phosphatase [Clostridia bacterium]
KEQELVERWVFHKILCVGANVAEMGDKLTVVVTVAEKDLNNETVEKVTSGLIKQKMKVEKVENTDSPSFVNVYLTVKPRFDVVFGVSSVAKDGSEISGDTHSVVTTDNGKCIVALCDGMGSGEQAEQMSATSISLVESFYRAGFDSDVILSCVNKLLTAGNNEVFCAVDIAVLDVYNGFADFIKLGASVGLVKRENKVEIVSGSSLPLGVLEEMTPSVTQMALNCGDVIALMSDGVVDCFADINELANVFDNVSLNVPQSIAEVIMSKALKASNNVAHDDMTVLVAKLA